MLDTGILIRAHLSSLLSAHICDKNSCLQLLLRESPRFQDIAETVNIECRFAPAQSLLDDLFLLFACQGFLEHFLSLFPGDYDESVSVPEDKVAGVDRNIVEIEGVID